MSSDPLPPQADLDQLRRRAKELRDAARSGDPAALGRITAHVPAATARTVTLATAQLAIAREHGYPSWPQLAAEVKARTAERGQLVDEFLTASARDWTGRAARMLDRDPWIAGYDFRTAGVLGDAASAGQLPARDPGLATAADPRSGWTALHLACASRWHRLDPARVSGLTEVARLLLDAAADPNRLLEAELLGESHEQEPPVPPPPFPVWCGTATGRRSLLQGCCCGLSRRRPPCSSRRRVRAAHVPVARATGSRLAFRQNSDIRWHWRPVLAGRGLDLHACRVKVHRARGLASGIARGAPFMRAVPDTGGVFSLRPAATVEVG
jgi:Ankyrin repeat